MRSYLIALVAMLCVTAAALDAPAEPPPKANRNRSVDLQPRKQSTHATLESDMRKLWEDHATWTRLYIVSALADLPDKEATATRLLKNQADIGDAIKPYYGEDAGEKLTALLKDHILIAVDVIDAAKSGDSAKKQEATSRWNENADEISLFLSQANPRHWPESEMKAMMREHLELTTSEVVARMKQEWDDDIAAYEKVHEQILQMADMLSAGVMLQFPEKFKSVAVRTK